MQVYQNTKELRKVLEEHRLKKKSIGLVPTMGALHEGHLSLVKKALADTNTVVVSIFVNPTQFDNKEDLEKYPSNLENDFKLLNSLSKDLFIFTPSKSEIYNGNVISKSFNFNGLDKVMEGAFRTGHFDGVATIVELLFKAVQPDRAYFGEKDFQQLQIIKKMTEQSHLNLKIVACPIEREASGLARSSRNERLSESTRQAGGFIYQTLTSAKTKFGTENAIYIKEWVSAQFNENETFELEYFEIADTETLTPTSTIQNHKRYRAFIAVFAEGIRLIDYIALN